MATHRNPDKFSLRLHKTGQWTKRVRGRQYYFGTNQDAALKEYVRVRDDLEAGRKPRPKSDGGITVADLANRFLRAKRRKVDAGEMSGRMWSEYHRGCESVVAEFGSRRLVDDLTPEDFGPLRARHAKLVGTYSVAKLVQVTRRYSSSCSTKG